MKHKAPTNHRKAIADEMRQVSGRQSLYQVFNDFVEMAAISLRNKVDYVDRDNREKRYLDIAGKYERKDLDAFCRALAHLAMALNESLEDVLGAVFHDLELGNKYTGQFFTPYNVSYMMAKMTMHDLKGHPALQEQGGFITAAEPACGAGGMIVAMAHACMDQEVDYREQLHVMAVDVDPRCVLMSYVQCALLGIPAIVHLGNTLTLEIREAWPTPAHIAGLWAYRLHRRGIDEADATWWRKHTLAQRAAMLAEYNVDLGQIDAPRPPRVILESRDAQAETMETA